MNDLSVHPIKERQSLYGTENEGKMGFVFLPINIYDSSMSKDRKNCVSASVQWWNTHSAVATNTWLKQCQYLHEFTDMQILWLYMFVW